ncbi:MAG: hypothetical protein KAU52_02850, partial [Methanosarcinales archaeon]|nr:hypothetical protein [Methanosarcinales archaeon]
MPARLVSATHRMPMGIHYVSFSDTYGLLCMGAIARRKCIELAGNCRMNNKQRRSAMTETDITAPMKGA